MRGALEKPVVVTCANAVVASVDRKRTQRKSFMGATSWTKPTDRWSLAQKRYHGEHFFYRSVSCLLNLQTAGAAFESERSWR